MMLIGYYVLVLLMIKVVLCDVYEFVYDKIKIVCLILVGDYVVKILLV